MIRFPKLEDMTLAIGNVKVLTDYNVLHTTTKYAIDSEGRIIYKGSGVFNLEQWTILLEGLKNS